MVQLVASLGVYDEEKAGKMKWVQHSLDVQGEKGSVATVSELLSAIITPTGMGSDEFHIYGPRFEALPGGGTFGMWVGPKEFMPRIEYSVESGRAGTILPRTKLCEQDDLVHEGAYIVRKHRSGAARPVPKGASAPGGASGKSGEFQIMASLLTGQTIPIVVEGCTNAGLVKRAITEAQGIPFDQQRLIFAGKQLQDYDTMADKNIKEGSKVHVYLRLRGGMLHISSGRHGFEEAGPDEKHECKDPTHCKSLRTNVVVKVRGPGGEGSSPSEITVQAFGCDRMEDVVKRIKQEAEGGGREVGETEGGSKKRLASDGEEDVGSEIARLAGEMPDGGRAVLDELRRAAAANKKGRR